MVGEVANKQRLRPLVAHTHTQIRTEICKILPQKIHTVVQFYISTGVLLYMALHIRCMRKETCQVSIYKMTVLKLQFLVLNTFTTFQHTETNILLKWLYYSLSTMYSQSEC